jgi:energy-coupling factor transporter ATP-binding protein EcfA2
MLEEDVELAIKVLIVGNGAVGKSSMIQRYCKGIFTHEYKKTIGVDFLEKKLKFVSRTTPVLFQDNTFILGTLVHLQHLGRRNAIDDLGYSWTGGVR